MTTLCFYQGLRTIGGTIVEVRTDNARCLFDFGLVYDPQIDARVLPRPDALVYDSLKTGALAMIDGLYDRDELRGIPLMAYGDTEPLPFVLISHMHIDHMGALGLLACDMPVYTSRDGLRLYRGLQKAGEALPRPHRGIYGVRPLQWKQMGDLGFRLIPVDHDVPGACGFEFETPDGRICYTGDLRLHGRKAEQTLAFADTVKHADVCITEGTMVSFIEDFDAVEPDADLSNSVTEPQVEQNIVQAAKTAAGMVFINLYHRNVERVHALIKAFNAVGRRFVLQYETALLYRQFYTDESICVYAPSAGKRGMANCDPVARDALVDDPGRYALDLPYEQLMDALDFPAAECLYIHSEGVPLGAYDPGYQKLRDFLARQGIAYRAIGCGGHASPAHLKYLLTRIAPGTLVPLHSYTPEKLRIPGAKQLLPEAGKRYALAGGNLTPAD